MNLAHCLQGVPATNMPGLTVELTGICGDSRRVVAGDLFVSTASSLDAGAHLQQALDRGAAALLVDSRMVGKLPGGLSAPWVSVDNLSGSLSQIAGNFFAHPSRQMRLIGVTGTNGKTSLCTWLEFLLCRCGFRAASLGTLGVSLCGEVLQPADGMTTRDAIESQRWLRQCQRNGAQICAMEVSSHGLELGRVAALQFSLAVLTNFSRDHLDFHGSEQAYWQAKRKLFDMPGLQMALVNLDDARGRELADELHGRIKLVGFSCQGRPQAQVSATAAQFAGGLQFVLQFDGRHLEFRAPALVAPFELSNLCAALAVALELGADEQMLRQAVTDIRPAAGRLQLVGQLRSNRLYVDYAHTPDAVRNSLQALKSSLPGKLLAVLGCGGDRDPGKRPQMAAAALEMADRLLITSDNPRSESPEKIADEMLAGVGQPDRHRVDICLDRGEAIGRAVAAMQKDYSVALLGKGHEAHQWVAGAKLPFSDVGVAAQCLVEAGGELL